MLAKYWPTETACQRWALIAILSGVALAVSAVAMFWEVITTRSGLFGGSNLGLIWPYIYLILVGPFLYAQHKAWQ